MIADSAPAAPAGPLDQPAQRAARSQHVGLAADLLQRARPHADGERRQGGPRRHTVAVPRRTSRRAEQVVVGASSHGWQAIPRDRRA